MRVDEPTVDVIVERGFGSMKHFLAMGNGHSVWGLSTMYVFRKWCEDEATIRARIASKPRVRKVGDYWLIKSQLNGVSHRFMGSDFDRLLWQHHSIIQPLQLIYGQKKTPGS